ncbi:MAG: M23 family metallopeptidase [Candidatus Sumerlaeaceae bacterium]
MTSGCNWIRACAVSVYTLTVVASSSAGPGKSPAPATPPELNIRIVGTASFQGKQTALVEDLNTRSDSFYTVGDPIYGYKITAIGADGIHLEKAGQKNFVAFEPTTVRAGIGEARGQVVVANTYLPADGIPGSTLPNCYIDAGKTTAGKTPWDLATATVATRAGKLPSMAGNVVASAASGLFSLPLANFKRLSSSFGYRKHPIGGGSKMHKGLDLSANRGTRIMAADNGTITWSGWKGGYGYCIIVDHQNGYETLYGHCSKLIGDVGDNVRRNDLIAEVGSTGASTGNHLHFEVHKNGVAVDPEPYLAKYL